MARGNATDFGDGMPMDDITTPLKGRGKMRRGGRSAKRKGKGRKSSSRY